LSFVAHVHIIIYEKNDSENKTHQVINVLIDELQ